jgi:large subunit ribosomal protein L32e
MADDKARLLKIKANLKKRQPKFIRQDAHKHKRVKQVWRSPKGLHSKMKDSRKGYRAKLQEGYHTPKAVRGMDKHGLLPTRIAGAGELAKLDPKTHSIIILAGLGGRKKLAILEEAGKRKFNIINATAETASKITSRLTKQHEEKKVRTTQRTKKHESLEAKADKAAKDGAEKTGADKEEPKEAKPAKKTQGEKYADQN